METQVKVNIPEPPEVKADDQQKPPKQKKRRHKGQKLTESQFGFLLLLPALLIFTFIIFYPFINSIIMSFTDRSLMRPESTFIAFENYLNMFKDPNFLNVLKNTLVFVIGGTLLPFTVGLIWAIVLNEGFRGSEFMRGLTLVCWIIPSTAISFLWMWIFQAHYGVLNELLLNVGLIAEKINWLGQTETAMLVVIIAKTWQTMPWFMIFLLGGLQGVPKEQIEAARIDGANNFKVFTKIILPNMKMIVSIVLILGTIQSLQHFDLIWVMTEGGPARATTTLAVEVYKNAFQNWELGSAAAIGTVWVLIVSIFSILYIRSLKDDLA
ncbi:carbohydrate ABC transporter permease [Virgibacillus senegalensis]|uniref:carbohydrate ABC transporter permease n=1 Tax=Virgibacillus senegalensis TaxID=1499679 RepID=UPI000AF17811|nr:sugar ABC transporter permease [Virgibacillus senegalensis]